MRQDVAKALSDPSWLQTETHGPVKVALEWLQRCSQK